MLRRARNAYGITLTELLVVIAIIGIVVVAFGFSFEGWRERYRVESEVKEMYTDFMDARARAMQHGRVLFVNVPAASSTRYQIYEDTNPAPDGDGTLDASDTKILDKETQYTVDVSDLGVTSFRFSRDGLVSAAGAIRFLNSATPDYDCIRLDATRINMGVWDGGSSVCSDK
jgi:prepilin-type N-terminal cleavage/methylation domain-containing protein